MTRYFDTSTLCLESGPADEVQIGRSLDFAIRSSPACRSLSCRFRVNVARRRDGSPMGFSFLFVTSPAIYHMLLGRKPDGSENVEVTLAAPLEDDKLETELRELEAELGEVRAEREGRELSLSTDWAEEAEEDDRFNRREEELEVARREILAKLDRRIVTPLPPLLSLPPCLLTPQQITAFYPPGSSQGPELFFSVAAAFVTDPGPERVAHVLRACNVPDFVTEEMISAEFRPYSGHPDYPRVTLNASRVAFVTFDPKSKEALFALHMMRKTNFRSRRGEIATVVFDVSYPSSRSPGRRGGEGEGKERRARRGRRG